MARTKYATEIHDTTQKSIRDPNVKPWLIVVHHAANKNFLGVVELELGQKEVSSTVVIKDDEIASMFDEQYRAWSLSDEYWDSVSLSSETCNETTAPGWTISDESYASLAKVIGDWCFRYDITPHRDGPDETWTVIDHGEVYTIHGGSYATACAGGIDMDRVVREVREYMATQLAALSITQLPAQEDEEEEMINGLYIKGNKKGTVGFLNLRTGLIRHVLPAEWSAVKNIAKLTGDKSLQLTTVEQKDFDALPDK